MNEISRIRPAMPSRVDDFLGRSGEVFAEQRAKVLQLEADYQKKRTEITTGYARRVSDLANEGAEALRKLDAEHQREAAVEEEKLEAIRRLRG